MAKGPSINSTLIIKRMLTPKFSLSQDSEFVYIHIQAPYIKLSETECYVEEDEFRFYSQPYYLRLHLPGRIQDDQKSTSQYDVDSGELKVRLTKQTKSENFEGLGLLTKLLTPKEIKDVSPEIEVLSKSDLIEEDESWFIEQKIHEDVVLVNGPNYGFANRKSNCLNRITSELTDMIDLQDPDNTTLEDRTTLRKQQEENHFKCEHYLADFFDDDIIRELITPDYKELTGVVGEEVILSDKENEKLLQLPRREYIIEKKDLEQTYLGLVDFMLAYSYNYRFTLGENGIESDWTVCKLSCTLSWLDSFQNVKDILISFARRSLVFPLYRNWELVQRVFSDVRTIFQVGKLQILKCLLGIHSILAESDVKYPLNDLYITDYCVWIQSANTDKIKSIAETLNNLVISKSDLNLKLDEMEADAKKVFVDDDSEVSEETVTGLMKVFHDVVTLKSNDVSDSDDSTTSDSDDESDDSSSVYSSDDSSESKDKDLAE
ncbi:Hsp90 cochaperone shq1 [Bulinus truncatus]|nr:Hsp90 cochaperone shq1 [Bulinus truncatus]